MALTNLTPADTFVVVETKLDATIDKVNEIDTNLTGGSTGQVLIKSTNFDYDYEWSSNPISRNAAFYAESTPQAMTGSYVVFGDLSHTTPNDGISRVYQIIAEAYSEIEMSGGVVQYAYRVYNTTTASALSAKSFNIDNTGSFVASNQNIIMYSGLIGPNETIQIQVQYVISNGGDMNVSSGSLLMTEISKL